MILASRRRAIHKLSLGEVIMSQMPSVGRIVHYLSYGTQPDYQGRQRFPRECRAAIITDVNSKIVVSLCVLNPTGVFFNLVAMYDDHEKPLSGTWHWPEQVDE
jgi:hypothetical protein